MKKVLFAADELTGLIGAAALMRPSKSCTDMEFDEFLEKTLAAMAATEDEIQAKMAGAEEALYIMSEYIVKIILEDVTCHITEEQTDCILKFLKSKIKADSITASISETPSFVDCGSNLEAIMCPCCGAQIDFGWWGEAMNIAGKNEFRDLSVTVPCCRENTTLNDLRYDLPCGFACTAFHILNPTAELCGEILSALKEMVRSPVRVIHAHL